MLQQLQEFFSKGNLRTQKLKKNVTLSILFKGGSILISFIAVPLYLDILSDGKYGVWLTINSVIAWFNLFDLGLGNGLRNRFAESLAKDEKEEAASYVSTTYAIVAGLSLALFCLFGLVYPFVDWGQVFNTDSSLTEELSKTVLLVFSFFCLQFLMQLIKTVVLADQRPSWVEVINFCINLLSFIGIIIISLFFDDSLFMMALAVNGSNVLVLLLISLILFKTRYTIFSPRWSLVDLSKAKDLFGLGLKFFVLQGAALVVFMTDNLIISHISDPEQVPPYNIAYRYFSVLLMLFTIVSNPYWSAFTEAFYKKDFSWIKRNIKLFQKVWLGLVLMAVLMVLFSDFFYTFWIGDRLDIPLTLTILFATWVCLSTSISIFSNFLSGIGKIKLSVYHAVFVMLINIPLSLWLGKNMGMGSAGVILATIIGLIPRVIFQPIQYFKIMNGSAKGLWNK